jgi:hypothetical protein
MSFLTYCKFFHLNFTKSGLLSLLVKITYKDDFYQRRHFKTSLCIINGMILKRTLLELYFIFTVVFTAGELAGMLLSDSGSSADWNMAAASKPALVRSISALADLTAPSPVAVSISSGRVIGTPANKIQFFSIDIYFTSSNFTVY